jgi:hypothetical protein
LDGVIGALAAAKREMDIAGWFESRAVIGVILPEIGGYDLPSACERFDARFRRELAKRLDADGVGRVSIERHVYPEPRGEGEDGVWQVDPLLYPERRSRQRRGTMYDAIKRGLDVVGSLTLLGVLAPLFLAIAALLKLRSRGPVFFRQARIGQMMKPFTMLKFRTMYSDADHGLHREFVNSFIKASGRSTIPARTDSSSSPTIHG